MSEQTSSNALRYVCPYPGCNRSFRDFWRLKVHYRAPPGARGSGVERGHGQELPFCPLCNMDLREVKYHKCAAGPSAPTVRARNQARPMLTGSGPFGGVMMPNGMPYQQPGAFPMHNGMPQQQPMHPQQLQQQHSLPNMQHMGGMHPNNHVAQMPGQQMYRPHSMGPQATAGPMQGYPGSHPGLPPTGPLSGQQIWGAPTATSTVSQPQQQPMQQQQQQQHLMQQQQQWWKGNETAAAAASMQGGMPHGQPRMQQQPAEQQQQPMQSGYDSNNLSRTFSAPAAVAGNSFGHQPTAAQRALAMMPQQQQQWQQQQHNAARSLYSNGFIMPQQQVPMHCMSMQQQQCHQTQHPYVQQQQPLNPALQSSGPFNFNQSSCTIWQGNTAAAAACTRPTRPAAAGASILQASTQQQHPRSVAGLPGLPPVNTTVTDTDVTGYGLDRSDTMPSCSSAQSAAALLLSHHHQQQQQQQQPSPMHLAVAGQQQQQHDVHDEMPLHAQDIVAGFKAALAQLRSSLPNGSADLAVLDNRCPDTTLDGSSIVTQQQQQHEQGGDLFAQQQQTGDSNSGSSGGSSGGSSPNSADYDDGQPQQQQQQQQPDADRSADHHVSKVTGTKRSAAQALDEQQQQQQLLRSQKRVAVSAGDAMIGSNAQGQGSSAAAATGQAHSVTTTDTPPPSEAQEALLQLAAAEADASAAAAGVTPGVTDSHHAAQVSALLGTALAAASSSMKDPALVVQKLLAALDDHIAMLSERLEDQEVQEPAAEEDEQTNLVQPAAAALDEFADGQGAQQAEPAFESVDIGSDVTVAAAAAAAVLGLTPTAAAAVAASSGCGFSLHNSPLLQQRLGLDGQLLPSSAVAAAVAAVDAAVNAHTAAAAAVSQGLPVRSAAAEGLDSPLVAAAPAILAHQEKITA